MKKKQKMIARYWVLQMGTDCDGMDSGMAVGFSSKNEADAYADESNEWSDGLGYYVISDFEVLLAYCNDYNIGIPEYAFETMQPRQVFARKCSVTGEGMNSGWIVNDGDYYFKNEKDALAHAISMGYESLDEAYENEEFYYTEWTDEGDYEYEIIDGELVEI